MRFDNQIISSAALFKIDESFPVDRIVLRDALLLNGPVWLTGSLGFDPTGLPLFCTPVLGEILPEFIVWAQVLCLSIFLCVLYLSGQNSVSFRVWFCCLWSWWQISYRLQN